jgi:carbonic anhydrase/acetyltransferase-like protein (isoleucine patch superfamily)
MRHIKITNRGSMLYSFEEKFPTLLGNNIFIAEEACVIGSVKIENNVCILPYAVIRGDNEEIHVGSGTNIQDGAILHTDPGLPMRIGRNVTIAHKATLHGCNVGDNSIIAINATILNKAMIGKNCVIGSNALILENDNIPDNSLVLGSPGKIKKMFRQKEIEQMKWFAQHYIEKIQRFNNNLIKINKEKCITKI